jgi:hypothetical protein
VLPGEQAFCDKFVRIMCAGYGILAFMLIIAGTSHFRQIPTRSFMLCIIWFLLCTLSLLPHTIDIAQRSNANAAKPNVLKWFSSTLLYVCDRLRCT